MLKVGELRKSKGRWHVYKESDPTRQYYEAFDIGINEYFIVLDIMTLPRSGSVFRSALIFCSQGVGWIADGDEGYTNFISSSYRRKRC